MIRSFCRLTVAITALLMAVHVTGQTKKRDITVADYAKWSNLGTALVSLDGKWFSYALSYDYGGDTLFVQNSTSGKRLVFPNAGNPVFSKDGKWLTLNDPQKGLLLRQLQTGQERCYDGAMRHEFHGGYLVLLCKKGAVQSLVVDDLANDKQYIFDNTTEFAINANGTIAASTSNEIRLITPGTPFMEKTIAKDTIPGFKKLVWSDSGDKLCFLQEFRSGQPATANHRIFYYNAGTSETQVLDPAVRDELKGQNIGFRPASPALRFTNDSQRIVFGYAAPQGKADDKAFEVWDSATPLEYSRDMLYGSPDIQLKLAVWSPGNGRIVKLGTNQNPSTLLLAGMEYALCFDPVRYEPQFEYYAPVDVYLKNTHTGKEILLLEKQFTGRTGTSPNGRFIHYFRDGDWWLYDIVTAQHRNLTAKLAARLIDATENYAGMLSAFDSPGWSADGQYFILYDQYDIWLLSCDGNEARKITNGSNTKTRYRICADLYPPLRKLSTDELRIRVYDLSAGLILEAIGEDASGGYFRWDPDGSLKKMVYNKSSISNMQKAAAADFFIYKEETASMPPRLMGITSRTTKPKVLFQSNPHASKFNWATAELIAYKDKKGNGLKGILYKPAGYVPGKKYPMVVVVYEKQSKYIHEYMAPTEYHSMGFTSVNYFLDGYLVLRPDIQYTLGEPGPSALDCVEAAVAAVKELGIVQEAHIGLMGHSFGGYETAFILTKSSTFAAAVCASGVMNMISGYLSHGTDSSRSHAWRYETQQFRMGFSPFDDWKSYERNSALTNAAAITTPILSWAGQKDVSVPWTQSAEFHMALRRLGKRNVFLVYPDEGHNINTPKSQKDLTAKTKNWFDFYLKDRKDALVNGIP